MTSVFDGIADLLGETITSLGLGQSVIWTAVGTGAEYNTATGKAQPSETETTVTAIVDSMTREMVQGIAVLSGDVRLTVAATEFATAPTAKGKVAIGGKEHAVMAMKPNYGGTDVLTYEFHCRRV